MDLSENGKCLFTNLQYVESSHAPYQRIRFFYFYFFLWFQKKILQKFVLGSSTIDAGVSRTQYFFFSKIIIFTNHSKCRNFPNQHIFWLFSYQNQYNKLIISMFERRIIMLQNILKKHFFKHFKDIFKA
jgi:hypothetical protein